MTKLKTCSWDGCKEEVASYPNSTLRRKYCHDHTITFALSKVRTINQNKAKKERIQSTKVTAQRKVDLMSTDEYRVKKVQPLINEIARLIDYGQPCIATGNLQGKMSGGHYFAVGHNRTTSLNLHNIHIQSFHSNSANGGDNIRYRDGIIKTYSIAYMEQIEALKQLKPLHLTKDDLKVIREIATEIVKYLRANLKVRTPGERIRLREIYNERLNIY